MGVLECGVGSLELTYAGPQIVWDWVTVGAVQVLDEDCLEKSIQLDKLPSPEFLILLFHSTKHHLTIPYYSLTLHHPHIHIMSHPTFVEADLEKGTTINGSNDEVNDDQFQTSKLDRVGTIVLTPEMFEKLYFQPQNKVSGNLRSTFGNPTAMYVFQRKFLPAKILTRNSAQHLVSLSASHLLHAQCLAGWDQTLVEPVFCKHSSARINCDETNHLCFSGVFLFTGGLLMFLGGILEFFIGNTFPFLVFCSMGGFFFSLASTSIPAFGVQGAFATAEYSGAHENPAFYSTFGKPHLLPLPSNSC